MGLASRRRPLYPAPKPTVTSASPNTATQLPSLFFGACASSSSACRRCCSFSPARLAATRASSGVRCCCCSFSKCRRTADGASTCAEDTAASVSGSTQRPEVPASLRMADWRGPPRGRFLMAPEREADEADLSMRTSAARALATEPAVVVVEERARAASRRACLAAWTASLLGSGGGGGSSKRSSYAGAGEDLPVTAAAGVGERVSGGDMMAAAAAGRLGLGFDGTRGLARTRCLVSRGAPSRFVFLTSRSAANTVTLLVSTAVDGAAGRVGSGDGEAGGEAKRDQSGDLGRGGEGMVVVVAAGAAAAVVVLFLLTVEPGRRARYSAKVSLSTSTAPESGRREEREVLIAGMVVVVVVERASGGSEKVEEREM
ncbi:uncharacterized protein IWZ02DRAFT_514058 [Phyllosticta citriasiana]|uniref:Uncharacterized protein n=1 Tax=Phyllosticta citriasiana TaxID=595635 RepID=A0ABR1KJ19_9PEZI